jgi:site-specific DNA-methyltransferase (adenine-specific)
MSNINQFTLHHGDCYEVMKSMPDNSVDSIVTDPPYELGFMGKSWDSTGIAYSIEMWTEALRVLKPGGHLLAFSGSRTYHRMAVAIEDAGFQIRDQIMWVYGSGFPKSMSVSKAVESHLLNGKSNPMALRKTEQDGDGESYQLTGKNNGILGETRVYDRKEFSPSTNQAKQWEGWGTALKPAHEPIVLARKPFIGTVASNVLLHGVGGVNIDASRIDIAEGDEPSAGSRTATFGTQETVSGGDGSGGWEAASGRWPANFIHDGSEEVTDLLGEPARFFYCAKANKRDRNEGLDGFETKRDHDGRKDGGVGGDNPRNRTNNEKLNYHPTVKPTALMQYLVRLVTPPNGTVLDPFLGSGSTGKACMYEGFNFVGIDLTEEYLSIAKARIEFAQKNKELK